MIELYSATRNVAIDAFFTDVGEYKAPEGWYFGDIVSVHGSEAPFSCPQAITYRCSPEALQRKEQPLKCTINSLGLDICLTSSVITVVRPQPLAPAPVIYIVAEVHVSSDFDIAPLTHLAREVHDEVITSYWSVNLLTGEPSLRETYIPPLDPQETLDALFAQNDRLLSNGHELMVRYYSR